MGEVNFEFDPGGGFTRARVMTKDGAGVVVRPARPEDRAALEAMFRSCSSDTLYTRFLSPGLGVPLRYLDRLMSHHPPTAMALVAEAGPGELKALVNFIETVPGEAGEIAIIVADDYQNRGLGRVMSNCLIELAKRQGARKFVADIDASNRRVFHLIKKSGLPSDIAVDQGIAHVEMDLLGVSGCREAPALTTTA